jgi:hypothetical protein
MFVHGYIPFPIMPHGLHMIEAFCFVRVPKLCPRPAFLTVLKPVAERRFSNLHIIGEGPKTESHTLRQNLI